MTHHQRLAASGSHRVLGDILKGIKRRGEILQVWPVDFIADNCCQVRSEIKRVFPNASMCLDVWHFKQRYLAVVMNGVKNPHRKTVAKDISNAVYKSPSSAEQPAEYRNKEEQETLLMEMFEKWLRVGSVWTEAASKVHANALGHVRQGCLTRHLSGIPSDGSRIEGLHRDLARIQHSVASGLEMVIGLTYDFYHRRNMRNALRKQKPTGFISTTYGSHHIHLVNAITHLWGIAVNKPRVKGTQSDLPSRPMLVAVDSMEVFGLVDSAHEFSLSGLISMKNDDSSDEGMLTESGMETWGQGGTPDVLTGLGLEIQPVHVRNRGVATNVTNPGRDMSPMVTAPQPRSVHASHQVKASALSQSLPLPEPNPKQLTRSQLLFQSAAGVDPRALRIGPGEDVAFFLFMEMRLENQWVSYDMTPARWVAATGEFNRRLGEDGRERGLSLVLKHPRALMGKLGEIEGTVADRLYRNDFKSAKGATAFWERHCKGVALPGSNMGDSHSKDKPRKVHICSRCRMIMFTGVKSKNHRKGICNDGVWQVVKPDKDSTPTEDRTPPQWPQPAGIFSKDKFSPLKFLKTLRELYGMVVTDGIGQADLPIEHQAFLGLLSERLKLTPTSITFPLYSHLELSDSVPSQWIDEEDGRRFLHLHCLQDASVL
ncbi:hypothetical protein BC826DRAFT_916945 [Russula brevipes]|nr:hypothetical protein BC826DRAFT_916945 [Russula brevipes]